MVPVAKKKGSSGKKPSKRKGGGEDEPDYEFAMPDFDEEAFRRKEIAGAQASFVAFGLAIGWGIVARVLQVLAGGDPRVGALGVLAGLGSLRFVLEHVGFEAALEDGFRSMIGDLFLMLFTSLAVWTLLSNPPFSAFF